MGMENDFTLGQDKYPGNRVEVYNTLINIKTGGPPGGSMTMDTTRMQRYLSCRTGKLTKTRNRHRNMIAAA